MTGALSLLIKPASALCGLDCAYCFYKSVAADREAPGGIMKEDVLRAVPDRAFALRPVSLSVAFQGGEPTLAGLDRFRRFTELLKEKNTENVPVSLGIQTNGMAIDGAWAAFFKEHGFLVGLSLDGCRETHDRFRRDAEGHGTFDRAIRAAETLTAYGVDYNLLSVITDESAYEIDRTWAEFKRRGFRHLQFIPLVDEGRGPTLGEEAYGFFLKRVFDLWYADFCRGDYISVRHIDNYVRILLGEPPENCAMGGVCGRYFVIEADGGVYPCDFYCRQADRLGSVFDDAPFALNEKHRAFIAASYRIHEICRACEFHPLCRGGCMRDRVADGKKNRYCAAYRSFFEAALPRLLEAARIVAAQARMG